MGVSKLDSEYSFEKVAINTRDYIVQKQSKSHCGNNVNVLGRLVVFNIDVYITW